MESKSVWMEGKLPDNLFIERLWRTVKYEEVYLKAYQMGKMPELESVIISVSTIRRDHTRHLVIGRRGSIYFDPFEESEKGVIESLTTSTTDAAGLYLNLAPCCPNNGSTSVILFFKLMILYHICFS